MRKTIMKIAMCIPSYNRLDLIGELIEEYVQLYGIYGIDVYIYDSRLDGKAKEIVEDANLDNLFYIHTGEEIYEYPEVMHGNIKLFDLYKLFSCDSRYEYIWICGDGMRYEKGCLDRLYCFINDKSFDYYIVRDKKGEPIDSIEYNNVAKMFVDWGWSLTLFGSVVVRRTVLSNVAWDNAYNKFLSYKSYNFSHVCLLCEIAYNFDGFRGVFVRMPYKSCHHSPRKILSGWSKDIFRVLFEAWPSAIDLLPFDNKDKKSIINSYYENVNFLNKSKLIRYRAEGLFNNTLCMKYLEPLSLVSRLDMEQIKEIANMPIEKAHERVKDLRHTLFVFIKNHENIAIYGDGQIGSTVFYLLHKEGLSDKIKCFVVTKKESALMICNAKPVVEIDELEQGYGIILGVNDTNKKEILATNLKGWNASDLFCENLSMLYMDIYQ